MCVKPWPIEPDQLFLAPHLAVVAGEPARPLRRRQPVLDDPAERPRLEPLGPPSLHATASASIDVPSPRAAGARRRRGADVVHPHDARALVDAPDHGGERAVVARIGRGRRRASCAMNDLRDGPTSTGTSRRVDQLARVARAARGCAPRSCRSRCRGRRTATRRRCPRHARAASRSSEEVADLDDDVVVARVVLHGAGLALHVHHDVARRRRPPPRRTCRGRRPAATSLTMVAPASSAAAATAALLVSTLTGTPALGGEPADDREHPPSSSALVDRVGARSGRLAADVEHVGPRRHQGQPVGRPPRRDRGSGRRRRTSRA